MILSESHDDSRRVAAIIARGEKDNQLERINFLPMLLNSLARAMRLSCVPSRAARQVDISRARRCKRAATVKTSTAGLDVVPDGARATPRKPGTIFLAGCRENCGGINRNVYVSVRQRRLTARRRWPPPPPHLACEKKKSLIRRTQSAK